MKSLFVVVLVMGVLGILPVQADEAVTADKSEPKIHSTLDQEPAKIDLDKYIDEQRPVFPGTKTVIQPRRIELTATLQEYPVEREISYLYTALSMMHVDPMPKVNHRMFIRSSEGKVIPVYVEDDTVSSIKKYIKEGEVATFSGYHVYNYDKGPAIVVNSVVN